MTVILFIYLIAGIIYLIWTPYIELKFLRMKVKDRRVLEGILNTALIFLFLPFHLVTSFFDSTSSSLENSLVKHQEAEAKKIRIEAIPFESITIEVNKKVKLKNSRCEITYEVRGSVDERGESYGMCTISNGEDDALFIKSNHLLETKSNSRLLTPYQIPPEYTKLLRARSIMAGSSAPKKINLEYKFVRRDYL